MSGNILDDTHFMCRPGWRWTYVCWKCGRIAFTHRGALRLDEKRCRKGKS